MQATFLLAEDVSRATFDRLNFQGCIVGDRVAVPHFPYELQTHIVGLAPRSATDAITFPGSIVVAVVHDVPGINVDEAEAEVEKVVGGPNASSILLVIPIRWWLLAPARLQIVWSMGRVSHSYSWSIGLGAGPSKGAGAPGLTAPILSASGQSLDLDALLASATSDLTVVDPYLPPEVLQQLVSSVAKTVRVRVLIPPKDRAAYHSSIARLQASCTRLEVRVMAGARPTGVFHDRFLIINSAEVYWFGTSLKQIASGRITRVAKLFAASEVQTVTNLFESEWARSAPV